jgi:hypothetical protein
MAAEIRWGVAIVDSDSAVANVLELVVPVVALAVIATPVVIAALKGRWWIGVAGALLFISGFAVIFGVFVGEPSAEFQETTTFKLTEGAVNVALYGGAFLLILGALLRPRAGSWWDRRRGAKPPTH